MAEINLDIPDRLLTEVERLAKEQGVTTNEFMIWCLSIKVGQILGQSESINAKHSHQQWEWIDNISQNGISVVILNDENGYRKLFVPFSSYPQIEKATLEQIFDIESFIPGSLYWPRLSLEIPIESLSFPGDPLSG